MEGTQDAVARAVREAVALRIFARAATEYAIESSSPEAAAEKAVTSAVAVMAARADRVKAAMGRRGATSRSPTVMAAKAVHKQQAVAAAKVVNVAITTADMESKDVPESWAPEERGDTEALAFPVTVTAEAEAAVAAVTMAGAAAVAALVAESMDREAAEAAADLLTSSQVPCAHKCGEVGRMQRAMGLLF